MGNKFFQDEIPSAMSLTDGDMEFLRNLVNNAVTDRMQDHCRFRLTDEQVEQFSHLVGMIADIGQQDLGQGIEVMRENQKFLKDLRKRGSVISGALTVALALAILSGVLSALWLGLQQLLAKAGS